MRLKTGDIVQHFKRETIKGEKGTKYLYKIIGIGCNTETKEKFVIYQPLYTTNYFDDADFAIRPYDMFMSEVDHEKYPNIKQKYRFEPYI